MNKKTIKILLIVLGSILLVGVLIYAKLFYIGSKSYENVVIDKVSAGNYNIIIKGQIDDSSHSYKDYSYTLVGSELYVSITQVLTSNKYKSGAFEIKIPVNASSVDNIHLTDDKTTKVIYSK